MNKNETRKYLEGYSIVELLVVTLVFTVLAIVATQSIALVLKGTTKSENIGDVRADVSYAARVIERSLRNATSIDTSTCHIPPKASIDYTDENGTIQSFSCASSAIFSTAFGGSLTTPASSFDCTSVFYCVDEWTVEVKLSAEDSGAGGALGSKVSERARIILRSKYSNY